MSEQELHCFTNGVYTVSAHSAEDAHSYARNEMDVSVEDDDEPYVLVPDDRVVRVRGDEPGEPDVVVKTAREWAAEGRGIVCSTEY